MPFCTNVLRVALNFKEEMIASVLIAEYKISLDEQMVIRALKTDQMNFLYCCYAFNKNYTRLNSYVGEDKESTETEVSEEEDLRGIAKLDQNGIKIRRISKYKTLPLDFLFKKVLELCTEDFGSKIEKVAKWGIEYSENFLQALLLNRQDEIACIYATKYKDDANIDLMVFTLKN